MSRLDLTSIVQIYGPEDSKADRKTKRWLKYTSHIYRHNWEVYARNMVHLLHGLAYPIATHFDFFTNFDSLAGVLIFEIDSRYPRNSSATNYDIVSCNNYYSPVVYNLYEYFPKVNLFFIVPKLLHTS